MPEPRDDAFQEHYRSLILGSLLRAAERRTERERASGHRMRARRAERDETEVRRLAGAPAQNTAATAQPSRFGRELRSSVRLIWLAALLLLVLDLGAFGIHSWTTSAADLGLIVLTLIWFWVCMEELAPVTEPRPEQLEPFD